MFFACVVYESALAGEFGPCAEPGSLAGVVFGAEFPDGGDEVGVDVFVVGVGAVVDDLGGEGFGVSDVV